MADPKQTIIGAYLDRSPRRREDRATDVLATVLSLVAEFAQALARDLAGLPTSDDVEVETQIRQDGCIIDLEVRGLNADRELSWLLWSEHKVDDDLTFEQLAHEVTAMNNRAKGLAAGTRTKPTTQLIAITRYEVAPEVQDNRWRLHRWTSVDSLASRTAAALRHRAGGTREEHLLREWLAFSERELTESVEPLTPVRLGVLPDAEQAIRTFRHLLEAGFADALERLSLGKPARSGGEYRADLPPGCFLAREGFKLYASYDLDPTLWPTHSGPLLVVGAWVDGDDATRVWKDQALRARLDQAGFSLDPWAEAGWIGFVKVLPLGEIVGTNLELQVAAVGDFYAAALRELVSVA
jgi:hypothetical protein